MSREPDQDYLYRVKDRTPYEVQLEMFSAHAMQQTLPPPPHYASRLGTPN